MTCADASLRRWRTGLITWVGSFKSASSRRMNLARGVPGHVVWQRSFYYRVIRNECELNALREYVQTNPLRWALRHGVAGTRDR